MDAAHDDDGDNNNNASFLCRVALQFPDKLLCDVPEVSWLMKGAIMGTYVQKLMSSTTVLAPGQ